MDTDAFVGRLSAVDRTESILRGERSDRRLTILRIEGPGGIGKTCLFEHVMRYLDLDALRYLRLHISANEVAGKNLCEAIFHTVNTADAIQDQPSGYYFHSVAQVNKCHDAIIRETQAELRRRHQTSDEDLDRILGAIDLAINLGNVINDGFPGTKNRIDFSAFDKPENRKRVEEIIKQLRSLRPETSWSPWPRRHVMKNAIKKNACKQLSSALVSDLSAILSGYQPSDWAKPTHSKIEGLDRLLLVIDDYEKLHELLDVFLLHDFLPALQKARFKTVLVILCRDDVSSQNPSWDQDFRSSLVEPIQIEPLSREEVDTLVGNYGVNSEVERERAWNDTQGYPYCVQLWIEERESGARSALMLKKFHDRTIRWMKEKEVYWMQHVIFLDSVNKRTLTAMLGDSEEAEEANSWFQREGSLRDTKTQSFQVRDYSRSRLLEYMHITDPDRYHALRAKAESAMMNTGASSSQDAH